MERSRQRAPLYTLTQLYVDNRVHLAGLCVGVALFELPDEIGSRRGHSRESSANRVEDAAQGRTLTSHLLTSGRCWSGGCDW